MSKRRKTPAARSKAETLATELERWRKRHELHIDGLIKARTQLKKINASIRRIEAKETRLKAEAAERRAQAKEARKALQDGHSANSRQLAE